MMIAEFENKKKITPLGLLLAFILFLLTIIAITPPKQILSKENVAQIHNLEDKNLIASQTNFQDEFLFQREYSFNQALLGKELIMSWKEKEM